MKNELLGEARRRKSKEMLGGGGSRNTYLDPKRSCVTCESFEIIILSSGVICNWEGFQAFRREEYLKGPQDGDITPGVSPSPSPPVAMPSFVQTSLLSKCH